MEKIDPSDHDGKICKSLKNYIVGMFEARKIVMLSLNMLHQHQPLIGPYGAEVGENLNGLSENSNLYSSCLHFFCNIFIA